MEPVIQQHSNSNNHKHKHNHNEQSHKQEPTPAQQFSRLKRVQKLSLQQRSELAVADLLAVANAATQSLATKLATKVQDIPPAFDGKQRMDEDGAWDGAGKRGTDDRDALQARAETLVFDISLLDPEARAAAVHDLSQLGKRMDLPDQSRIERVFERHPQTLHPRSCY